LSYFQEIRNGILQTKAAYGTKSTDQWIENMYIWRQHYQ